MTNMVNVKLGNKKMKVEEYTKVKECINDTKREVLAVKINNSIHSVYYPLVEENNVIELVTFYSDEGKRIYSRTLKYIFLKACFKLGLNLNEIEFTNKIENNYFIRFKNETKSNLIDTIKEEMWNIILSDLSIVKTKVSYEEARKIYEKMKSEKQLENFRIKTRDTYTFYECEGYFNYLYGLIAPSTGYIKNFDIISYNKGALLILPDVSDINSVNTNIISNNVFNEFTRFKKFEKNIGISNVSDMNIKVLAGSIGNIIRFAEIEQSRRFVEIVNSISNVPNLKAIFIAGPSSSGKTTFAQKLEDGLKIIGKNTIRISMDNYFKDLDDIPVVNGKKDYEGIENVELDLFKSQINTLLNGNTVNIPTYNFKKSKKEYKKRDVIYMSENDILIIEGIHALNPIVHNIINVNSFKIYLAPLVTLGLDNFTKVSSNDTRLIRRIVRDADIRGVTPENSLKSWKDVLIGEKKNIFPFVNSADEIFNTNLVYEIGVLKPFAEKLLLTVPETSEYFSDARRLYKLLQNFLSIETSDIPKDSIIKEFIGNGCFNR